MAKTDAATAARKEIKRLEDQFGEFIPKDIDARTIYKQWKSVLFAEEKEADDELLFRALTMAKLANIDIRGGLLYIKDGNVIINIDGLVAIADQTGQYGGTSKVEYQYDENKNAQSVRVGIYKVIGEHVLKPEQIVFMNEYDTGDGLWAEAKDGGKKMTMLKKVGLAHVIRASFTTCAGLYIPEEVDAKISGKDKESEMESNIKKALAKQKKNGKSNVKSTKSKAVK